MGLPQLTTCCFVFDLTTGLTILGVLNAVMSFTMFIIMVVCAAMFGSMQNLKEIADDPDAEAEVTGLYVITIILCLLYMIKFFSDLIFIFAVLRERAAIIKMYLIIWIAFFLMSSFLFFLHVSDYHTMTIVTQLFFMGVNIYVILLANSFYKQLNTREEL